MSRWCAARFLEGEADFLRRRALERTDVDGEGKMDGKGEWISLSLSRGQFRQWGFVGTVLVVSFVSNFRALSSGSNDAASSGSASSSQLRRMSSPCYISPSYPFLPANPHFSSFNIGSSVSSACDDLPSVIRIMTEVSPHYKISPFPQQRPQSAHSGALFPEVSAKAACMAGETGREMFVYL